MAGQSCLRWELPDLCVSGGFGSTPLVHLSGSKSQANRWSTRRRPRRATDWRSHEPRGTRISIASTPAVLSRRSRRPRRLKPTRTFPPDGRRIAFGSGRSGHVQIWVAAADGSNARQLTHDARQWPGSPSWSPDGRSIAFDSGGAGAQVRIWIIDADGGTPRQITSGPGNHSVPRWSGDGKWIYFAHDLGATRDIWRVPSRGGQPQQVTRTGSGFVAYEFDGGTSLLYQPVNGDSALLLLSLTGDAEHRQLVDCVRSSAFAPAGNTVVYVPCDPSARPPLRAIDPVSGKDRLLGRLEDFPPRGSHVNLAVSPDGSTILFKGVVGHSGDVILIENFR